MARTPLTVIIPCKDELPNIEACLDSVSEIADELIVADSGSTDGTLELVRQRGDCRVIEREYVNSANFKNWAIPQASHEWVLVVDADERVTPELATEIRQLKEQSLENSKNDAYRIHRRNYFMGRRIRYSGWQNDSVVRLFRRACRYEEKHVHAELDVRSERIAKLAHCLSHNTFRSLDHYLAKIVRYSEWGAQDCLKRNYRAVSFADLSLRPGLRFFRHYVVQGGVFDGWQGLLISAFVSFGVLLKYAKLWEYQRQETNVSEKSQGQPAFDNVAKAA